MRRVERFHEKRDAFTRARWRIGRAHVGWWALLSGVGWSAPLPAQDAGAVQAADAVPLGSAQPAPVGVEGPQAAVAAPECVPACRSGYVCLSGQCVSACNPPCADGWQCTAAAECVAAPALPVAAQQPPREQPVQPTVAAWGAPRPAQPAWADSAPPAHAESARRVRYHDGFYLRLGVGAGALGANVEASDSDAATQVHVSGVTIPVEVAIGGTPAPGLALGAGIYGLHLPSAQYTAGRGDYVRKGSAEYGAISMFGPFIDVYLEPRHGVHFQLAPCFTAVSAGKSEDLDSDAMTGTGYGAMVGAGIESWVGEQWGLGVLARLQYASVELEDDSGDTYDLQALVPSLLVTATLH